MEDLEEKDKIPSNLSFPSSTLPANHFPSPNLPSSSFPSPNLPTPTFSSSNLPTPSFPATAGTNKGSRKKVLFLVVRPLRRGGGKGPTTKEKITLKKI